MSASPPKADIAGRQFDVEADIDGARWNSALGPKADIRGSRLLPCNLTLEPHFRGRKFLL
jgi:hypothetical protein